MKLLSFHCKYSHISLFQVGIALDETVEKEDLDDLFWVFNCKHTTAEKVCLLPGVDGSNVYKYV